MQELVEGLRVVRAESGPLGVIPVGAKGTVQQVQPASFRVVWELELPWPRQVYTRDCWGTVVVPDEQEK